MLVIFPSLLYCQPKYLLVGGTHLDLGDVPNFIPSKRTLTIKNVGTDTLIITDVGSTCGCTATLLSQDHIAPSDSGTLSVTFDAKRFEGKVEKRISMRTNDTAHIRVEIKIIANVIKLLEIEPEYIFFKAVKDSATTQTLTLKNVSPQTISILSYHTASDYVAMKLSSDDIKPGEAATLTVECAPKSSGTFNGNIEIKTDHEKASQLSIRFFGWAKDK